MVAERCFEVVCELGNDRFYVLAGSAEAAIERVKSATGPSDLMAGWDAVPAPPALTFAAGIVFDAAGRPIKKIEA